MSVWHLANTQYILTIIIIQASALSLQSLTNSVATNITHVKLLCGNINQRRKYISGQEGENIKLDYGKKG